ncbi:MAG: hypothetical protein ABIN18_09080 [Pseudomonadota bacterium]
MKNDKKLVINFFRSKNIEARHFPKKVSGKKPDFVLFLNDNIFGYCELKSIVDYDLYGERHDSTYNKIQNKIHEASNQFTASNSHHTLPNILFFINHCVKISFQNLWYVLTGQTTSPNLLTEPIDLRYLQRLIRKNDLINIDYIIWTNTYKSMTSFILNQESNFTEQLKNNISSKAYE